MSLYLKQISQLVALQRIDSEILTLREELEVAPKEVNELEGRFQTLEEQRTQHLAKLDYLKAQELKLGSEIEDDSLKIKKSKNKLMMVSNTKEYHAMMREMDNLEKLNRMREEERIALSEELERQKEALSDLDKDSESIKEDLEAKRSTLQKRVNEAQARLDELDRQRREAGESVPKPVLGRYEFIRSRLAAPVIVHVQEGVCAGCNISIPPQSFIELQKGQQILSCPNCQRLIYWCEHFTPPEQSACEADAKEAEAAEAAE